MEAENPDGDLPGNGGNNMKQKSLRALLCLLLLPALLLAACGTVSPAASPTPAEPTAPPLPEGAVLVSTVDELLAAIAPNALIVLQEGDYDLSTASNYGEENLRGYYRWELVYGGCALTIVGVPGLQLRGQGQVRLLAQPRYAEVLTFRECWDLSLEGMTLGHTQEPGPCSAGVLTLQDCDTVTVSGCRLFGCGSMGISANNCNAVAVRSSQIDSCSDGAVTANGCRDLRLEDCKLCDCGLGQNGAGGSLVSAQTCVGLALVNCEITGNRVNRLLQNYWSQQVALLGCKVENNRILISMFLLEGRSVTVDKCSFQHRSDERYYESTNSLFAQDLAGENLISFDLDRMELGRAEYAGPVEPEPAQVTLTSLPDGTQEAHVSTVDELLAAIAPDTCIVLEPGVYDLSTASDYGTLGGAWYDWEPVYDGYTLLLSGVRNLMIRGAGRGETLISVLPRYAAVFSFRDCENIALADFTAGHSEAPGYCAGNVLDFDSCRGVSMQGCGLFGCGVMGIWAFNCIGFQVRETEIYECTSLAATIDNCRDMSFEGCSIYDCDDGNNKMDLFNCSVTWNSETLKSGSHWFDHGACTGGTAWDW